MSVIDEVKQRIDIVEVISDYLPLQKSGRNFKALCPFHPEKVPSFYIFPERQSWHCFGACGTGGDVFSFVMKKEGVDFGEALRILAQRSGVPLTAKQPDESQKEVEKLKEINEAAAEYYHYLLLHSPAGERARTYLAQRGVSAKTVEDFQLGFSLDSWEALREQLTGRGYQENELVAARLLVEKEQGRTYDCFRNRLMFPIRDIAGRVSGFGARVLDDSLPKYLNSPQTAIFDKSGTLYGIDRAKSAIRKQNLAVVVEGYMDVIIAHQYGFSNVVASLGTALTEKQVGIIKKLTKDLTLALDADTAGEIAMLRGQEVIAQTFAQPTSVPGWTDVKYENLYSAEWKVAVLPQGKDPDEIIKESTEQWQQLVGQATPVVDYVFDMVSSKLDLSKLSGKSSAVDQLLPIINGIKDPIRQAHYLQKLARLVAVHEHTLASALKRIGLSKRKWEGNVSQPSSLVPSLSPSDPLAEYCLSLLARYPELRSYATDLSVEYFGHSEHRELFLVWCNTTNLDSMRRELDSVLQDYLDVLLSKPLPSMSEEEGKRALVDCIHRLKEHWLRELKVREEILISDVEAKGNATELEELQRLGVELNTQLREVFLRKSKQKG